MDSVPAKTKNVFVTVTQRDDGSLTWTYDNHPGSGDNLDVTTAETIIYTLTNSPGFQFCEPPDVYKDPNSQLFDPNYAAKTCQVTDVDTVQSATAMGIYLYVKELKTDTVYQSPDPEITNTEGP
ncbi:DP-EP family protein [Roseiterribacter gracilis]|uniref:Uncharacterized protein n=1 Tax=Roseiterribacter gracilis TaxID=2812848 RepID=A0A8S8XKI6_9PROT|nr:hypothetical protein TMPK1_38830 [Rhodospirillales bacterium TMPK1]